MVINSHERRFHVTQPAQSVAGELPPFEHNFMLMSHSSLRELNGWLQSTSRSVDDVPPKEQTQRTKNVSFRDTHGKQLAWEILISEPQINFTYGFPHQLLHHHLN